MMELLLAVFMALSISQKPLTPGNNVEIKCSEESNINGANINGANRQNIVFLKQNEAQKSEEVFFEI